MAKRALLRAADADREYVAERLRKATAEGRLLAEELEERLEATFSARTYGELESVISDLPREPVKRARRSSLPIPWPAAVFALVVLMPVVVAVMVAALVLVASMFAMWVVMAAVVAAIFGRHRVPYGPHRYYSRSWHAASSRWRA
jgi:hypothetical protein